MRFDAVDEGDLKEQRKSARNQRPLASRSGERGSPTADADAVHGRNDGDEQLLDPVEHGVDLTYLRDDWV